MNRIVELTKATRESSYRDSYNDTDDPTEGGALTDPAQRVSVDLDWIRAAYPRKNNAPGTRITFKDGGGFAVTEPYETVKGYWNGSIPLPGQTVAN